MEGMDRARLGALARHFALGARLPQYDGDEDQCRHRPVGGLFRRARAVPHLRFSSAADPLARTEPRLTRIAACLGAPMGRRQRWLHSCDRLAIRTAIYTHRSDPLIDPLASAVVSGDDFMGRSSKGWSDV